jgi:hypothetical protein
MSTEKSHDITLTEAETLNKDTSNVLMVEFGTGKT